jgi:hypothetical protein
MPRELHAEFLVDAFFSIDVVFDHQRPGQNIIRQGGGFCNQGMEEEYENPGPITPAYITSTRFLDGV